MLFYILLIEKASDLELEVTTSKPDQLTIIEVIRSI